MGPEEAFALVPETVFNSDLYVVLLWVFFFLVAGNQISFDHFWAMSLYLNSCLEIEVPRDHFHQRVTCCDSIRQRQELFQISHYCWSMCSYRSVRSHGAFVINFRELQLSVQPAPAMSKKNT